MKLVTQYLVVALIAVVACALAPATTFHDVIVWWSAGALAIGSAELVEAMWR